MGISLDQWDQRIGPRLDEIRWHADAILRAVNAMHLQPDFEAWAEGQLVLTKDALTYSLRQVSRALDAFREKPHDTGAGS
ncbi:hypothetical protein JQ636_04895 [Bradyrhizobium japonicum]|uniref:hypothetical protein n=1 Tax=Bradyrhizobium japonicum TaxID=375 RepID=UPI001BA76ACF|nr:hypothetical protein [Bradyrhizobium japonicum]MBR0802869.1 hypothetical protein [Bradyrhizobium japonicum]